ncbi:MAG: cation transporter [Betaproteobacteria bacterium]|nr:cation transporter [Betaproteobacteria bacterium]
MSSAHTHDHKHHHGHDDHVHAHRCPTSHAHQPLDAETDHHHGHDHGHDHGHHHEYRAKDRSLLLIAFAITVAMMVAEIVTGWLTHSLALISDGVHMFTHAFALGLSWAAILLAARPASGMKTFGYYRIEVVAAFVNGVTVLLSAIWIVVEAVGRILVTQPVEIGTTLIVAVLGLVVNIITGAILLRADQENLNIRSAVLHMVTDALSSVAIIIGLVVIHFTSWHVIDPLIAVLVAALITKWSWSLLSDSLHVLLEGSPIDTERVRAHVKARFPEVVDLHDLHVWQISQRFNCLTAHVLVSREYSQQGQALIGRISHDLKHEFGIGHTTLQLEWQ